MAGRTVRFRGITTEDFETYFSLGLPGIFIARDAMEAGEVGNATDALEVLVLANKLFVLEFRGRVCGLLAPYGKAAEYLTKEDTDGGVALLTEVLGARKVERIVREVVAFVKEQSKVGTGENDKAAHGPPIRRSNRRGAKPQHRAP